MKRDDSARTESELLEIAEVFVEHHRRGGAPTIDEYAQKHPELAPQIRELFPTLVAMERLGGKRDGAHGQLRP